MRVDEPTLDQRRAAHALNRIRALQTQDDEIQGRYRSYVQALPAEIMMNGLGQALATHLAASSEPGHSPLYEDVSRWLCRDDRYAPYPGKANVIDAICRSDAASYRQAHTEAMHYLLWLKKFAVAFLKKSPEEVHP